MNLTPMSIREAARWAARKDILCRVGRDGSPQYLYAVYTSAYMGGNAVECIGSYAKCREYVEAQKRAGRTDAVLADLDETWEQMCCDEGEARCVPSASEQMEWA
jgi:hypothetical protein